MQKIVYSIVLILAVAALGAAPAWGQSWGYVTSHPAEFYFGEGYGGTEAEADQEALRNLLSQIKMHISVRDKQRDIHATKNGEIVADNTLFESTFSSYGQATLENTMRLDLEKKPRPHVARWIKRADVEKLWESRRQKIHEMINSADEAETKGKVDVALRNYYWALALLRTMQRSGSETYQGHTLMPWLRERIDAILSDIKVVQRACNGDDGVELAFTFRGKPVTSLDFSYIEGGYPSGICSVKDGIGYVELVPGWTPGLYDVNIEVAYAKQTRHDPELQSVVEGTDPITFPKARLKVRFDGDVNRLMAAEPAKPIVTRTPDKATPSASATSFTTIAPERFKRPAESSTSANADAMAAIVAAIKSRRSADVRSLMEDDAYATFSRLLRYGNAKVVGTPTFKYMPFGSDTWARGLNLSFHFNNGVRRNFTEDVVFTFNPAGKVSNISFGLGQTAEDDIMGRTAYPEQVRKILVDFIQNYQTAFAMNRLDYIRQIFDDNALIIVGKVVRSAGNTMLDSGIRRAMGERYEYNRLTKQQYMANLERCFKANEYINLRFNRLKVQKANNPNGDQIYGVQLEQDFYSSNYNDHGYLFLEINLNNPTEPLILVRTWQPQPDPDFGLYEVSSFNLR